MLIILKVKNSEKVLCIQQIANVVLWALDLKYLAGLDNDCSIRVFCLKMFILLEYLNEAVWKCMGFQYLNTPRAQ